ncbi:MAG: HAD family hydrolase [Deltaproteobacteria bacterium]|nr:HAD family hydrolase [Deltaproteobacteria bacterium]
MMPRAVTFDLDGTLYDAARARWPILWAAFPRWRSLRVGRAVREELRARAFASGAALRDEEARLVGERLDVAPALARARLDAVFDGDVVRALSRVGPRPEARAALERLAAAGVMLGVVSDRRIAAKLAALGLDDLPWRVTISADELGALKPAPAPFLAACAGLGVAPIEAAHVGDRADTDEAGARAAGMRALVLGRDGDLMQICTALMGAA